MQEKSLYIHIPFCRSKCGYCDFYSVPYREQLATPYIEALCDQISAAGAGVSTVYIGGGTPSVLNPSDLRRLLLAVRGLVRTETEFTVEVNPESASREKLKLLFDGGVNRLSIGVQSFDGRKLRRLGRIHTAEEAREAIYAAEKVGFKNVSVDLIFGVWEETLDGWRRELETVSLLPVEHISCYALTYEKDTPIFKARKEGIVSPLGDEVVADMYLYAIDYLVPRGLEHYEVSNFATKGFRCRHNLSYWDNGAYLGLGASAVSYTDGVRRRNISDVNEYISKARKGESTVVLSERLSDIKRAKETAAVKIRTKEGIDFRWFREKTGFDIEEIERQALAYLLDKGLIEYKDGRSGVCLSKKGFLFCDTASSELT